MSITGTSSGTGAGIYLGSGTLALSNNGTGPFQVTGNATNASSSALNDGFWIDSGGTSTKLQTTGTMTLSGTTANTSGSAFYLGNSTLSNTGGTTLAIASGNLTLAASASNGGFGFRDLGTLALTNGTGTSTITGTSTTNNAIYLSGATITNAGSLTIAGSATSGNAVYLSSNGASTQSFTNTGSTFAINGTSGSGNGLKIVSGTVTTAGGVALSGTSTNGAGVLFTGSNALKLTSGALTLSGATSSVSSVGIDLSSSGNTITNSGSGLLTVSGTGGDKLGATIASASGNVVISDTGTVTQPSGSITAGNLLLSGTGTFTLNESNAVTTLAANAGAITFYNGQSLTIGTVQATVGITTTGTPIVDVTSGDLTIAASTQVSGVSPLLAAASAFVNNAGSGAVVASSGSWQIYSVNSAGDTFGNLNSSTTAIWNTTYSGTSNAASGNRYLFAAQPTLTFTSASTSKVYGTNDAAAVASSYTISGYQPGVANAYQADTASTVYSGTPSVTSTATGTGGAAGSYPITAAAGTVTAVFGYALSYASSGTLTVMAAPLTVTGTKAYTGTTDFTYGQFIVGGAQNGETVTLTADSANTSGADVATYVGTALASLAAAVSGGNASTSNYTLPSTGLLIITAAPLTIIGTKVYTGSTGFTYGQFIVGGAQNGETVTLTGGFASTASPNVGTFAATMLTGLSATVSGGSAAISNYALPSTGSLSITPAPLTITGTKTYTASNGFPYSQFAVSGAQNSETVTLTAGSASTSSGNVGTYAATALSGLAATVSGGNATISNYALPGTGLLSITPAPLTITAASNSKVYDGTTAAAALPTVTSGTLYGSDTAITAERYAAAAAGTGLSLIPTASLSAPGNYSVSYVASTTGVITPAPLTITAASNSKVYDGTTAAAALPTVTSGTLYGSDTAITAERYAAAAAGTGLSLIPTASLSAPGNYSVSYVASTTGVITPAPLTITAASNSKVYDGTTAAAALPTVTSGTLYGSDTAITAERYAAAAAGTGLSLIPTASLSAPGNYSVSYVASTTGVITAAPLTITAASNSNAHPSPQFKATISGMATVSWWFTWSFKCVDEQRVGTHYRVALSAPSNCRN